MWRVPEVEEFYKDREWLLPVEQHSQHGLDPRGKSQNTPSYQFEVQKAELCEMITMTISSLIRIIINQQCGKF